jgi:hypothetical protein
MGGSKTQVEVGQQSDLGMALSALCASFYTVSWPTVLRLVVMLLSTANIFNNLKAGSPLFLDTPGRC